MRKIILTLVVCLFISLTTWAQYDEKFYSPSKEWRPIQGVDYKEIKVIADKDTLSTVLFIPQGVPKATIMFYHGSGGNISTNTGFAKLFVKANYQVFMVDFRGYGKSTGKPTHLNIASDAQLVFDRIMVMEEFKQYPILVYGSSMGTQVATKITRDNENRVSALILDGTISSFTDMALLSAPPKQRAVIASVVTSPYSAKEDIKFINSVPKLFIHSKEDTSVPFGQCEKVYANAITPKEQWVYKGKHLCAAKEYPILYLERINSLFAKVRFEE